MFVLPFQAELMTRWGLAPRKRRTSEAGKSFFRNVRMIALLSASIQERNISAMVALLRSVRRGVGRCGCLRQRLAK